MKKKLKQSEPCLVTTPVLEYLRTCSPPTLEQFELARLNEAANLQKDLLAILNRLVAVSAEALLARTLLESRKAEPLPTIRGEAADLLAELTPEHPETQASPVRLLNARK